MPSGKTHDQITWWSTPPIIAAGWFFTRDLAVAALMGASFAFAGLMFSGDLDLKSVQYKRWGWFRWIWIPYQKMVPHRSPLSHGPVLGLATRLVYLSLWLMAFALLFWEVARFFEQDALIQQSHSGVQQFLFWMRQYPLWGIAALLGLWAGGLSHTLADELGSGYKRVKRRRKKRKETARRSSKRRRKSKR